MPKIKFNKLLLAFLFFSTLASAENFTLKSPDFLNNQMIPAKFTCNGQNISPALSWENIPPDTKSLILIMDDPDAPNGTWTHWILNIPPKENHLDVNNKKFTFGLNSWQKKAYGGPCPPSGIHHYIFTLYALDKKYVATDILTNKKFSDEMKNVIIEKATLVGIYEQIK